MKEEKRERYRGSTFASCYSNIALRMNEKSRERESEREIGRARQREKYRGGREDGRGGREREKTI